MKAEDDKRNRHPEGAGRPDAKVPRGASQPEGVDVEWTAEEHRLLAELESGKDGDLTEAIRRLVVGMLRQVRADLGKLPPGELDEPENPETK